MCLLTCGHIQHMYSWWWVGLSPEICRVKHLRRINRNCCISLELFHYKSMMHGTTNIKFCILSWRYYTKSLVSRNLKRWFEVSSIFFHATPGKVTCSIISTDIISAQSLNYSCVRNLSCHKDILSCGST